MSEKRGRTGLFFIVKPNGYASPLIVGESPVHVIARNDYSPFTQGHGIDPTAKRIGPVSLTGDRQRAYDAAEGGSFDV